MKVIDSNACDFLYMYASILVSPHESETQLSRYWVPVIWSELHFKISFSQSFLMMGPLNIFRLGPPSPFIDYKNKWKLLLDYEQITICIENYKY